MEEKVLWPLRGMREKETPSGCRLVTTTIDSRRENNFMAATNSSTVREFGASDLTVMRPSMEATKGQQTSLSLSGCDASMLGYILVILVGKPGMVAVKWVL